MKAIAFAILIASFNLIPKAEIEAYGKATQNATFAVMGMCIIGFILCLVFEK